MGWQPLQVREPQRLVDYRLQLAVDGHDVAIGLARCGSEQRVDEAGILRLGEIERDVLGLQPDCIGLPVGLLATAIGHGL